MFFFDRCQSKYAWALSAVLRLHTFEVPDPANRLVHTSNSPTCRRRYFPRAGRALRAPARLSAIPPRQAKEGAKSPSWCRTGRRNGPPMPCRGSPRCGSARIAEAPATEGLVQCRLHSHDTSGNHAVQEWCSTSRARATARLWRVVRHAAHHGGAACRNGVPAARQKGGPEGISQGTFLARLRIRRSGMRNAGENDRRRRDR